MQILSNLSLYGTLGLNSVADANTDTDKFLVIDSNGIVKYRTGAELYNDIGAGGAAAYTSVLQHTVKAGVALTKGQAVYVTSADGTNMIVGKASNASEATSSKTLGLIAQDLALNGQGFVITEGLLAGLDTSTAAAGDPVWLGTDGNLIYGLLNKPYAPEHLVFIGIVTRAQQNNGEIFVKVQNGFEINELHNVQISSTPSDNSVLSYETSTSLYKMKPISTLLGYTPANSTRTLTINGTSYDLSADRSWSIAPMVYPGAGIAVSTGSSWGTSITDNSSNWNTAYSWGNHASAGYLTASSAASTYLTISNASSTYLSQSSANTIYLNKTDAASTYLSQSSANTIYLNKTDAASTYLSQSSAASTYLSISNASSTYLSQSSAALTYVSFSGSYSNPSWVASLAWSKITGAPAFLTSYTETDTLASVTARGASTSTAITLNTGGNIVSTSTWEKWKLVTTGVTAPARQGSDANGLNFTSNALWNSGWSQDDSTKKSMAYIQHLGNGRHEFRTSPSGGTVTWTTGLTIDEAGANFNVPLTISSNTILHAGNYSSYALPLSGGTMTGTPVFTSVYGNPGGDYTGITTPAYKVDVASGYWRVVYKSAHSVNSGVYNYETGKNVYWGEPSDTGGYYFRGRTLYITESNGTDRVVIHAGNVGSYSLPIGGGTILGNITYNGYALSTSSYNIAHILGNWAGSGYWGMGSNGTHTIRIDQVNSLSGQQAFASASDVQLDLGTNRVLHAGNYNSYSPSLTGSGASGTWGISITGNADTVDGYHASGLLKLNEWNGNLYLHTDGRIYGTIFYDASDSTYYLNPNSTSYLYSVRAVNDVTTESGQGRFGGWYTGTGYTGAAVEVGFSGGNGNVISYNRITSAYQPLYVSGSNLYLQQQSGLVYINSALVRQGAGQGWLSGNYGTAESTATSGAIYSIGGSYVPTSSSLNNMYGIGYTYGGVAGLGASTAWGLYVVAGQGSAKVFLDADNGVGTATGSWRAPVFYDSANTSYYGDFDSTSRMYQINVNYIHSQYTSITGPRWDTSFYVLQSQHWYAHSSTQDMYLGESNVINVRNTAIAVESFRAPIFYDSNDTGYYGDFASISRMYGIAIRGDNNSYGTDNQIFFWGAGNSTTSAIGFKANGGAFGNPTGFGDGYNTYLTMDTDGRGWVFRRGVGGTDFSAAYTSGWILNNGVWQANASMRAPIFYDSNDTSYYVDPNSTSRLRKVFIQHSSGNSEAGPALRVSKGWDSGTPDYAYDTVIFEANDVVSIRMKESDGGTAGWSTGDGHTSFTSSTDQRFYVNGSTSGYIYSGMGGTLALSLDTSGNVNTSQTVYAAAFRGNANVGGTGQATYHPAGIYSTGTNWLYGTMYLNVNSINDTADIRTYNSSYHFRARYTAGSDVYHASLNWYGLQLGNNGGNYIVAGRTNPGGKLYFYTNNTSDFSSINGTFAAAMHASGRTSFGSDSDNGYQLQVYGSLYSSDWIRVAGSSGLYFESYGGGWRMTGSSYIESYNGKSLHMGGASVDYVGSLYFSNAGHIQPNAGSYGALQMTNSKNGWAGIRFTDYNTNLMSNATTSGFHHNDYGWQFRWSSGNMYISSGTYGGGSDYTVIHSGNIGSQSVNYANTAGSANSVSWNNVSSKPNLEYQYDGVFTAPSSPDGSGYVWLRIPMGEFNAGGDFVRFSISRAIFWNGSSPYGGPSMDVTAYCREWHGGQQGALILYGEHGSVPGSGWITHAGSRDLAGGGYWFYMRVYAGVDYRYMIKRGSGSVGTSWQQTTDPGSVYTLSPGLNNIGPQYTGFNTTGYIYAGNDITAYSDASVKENIRSIDNPLERVLSSRGVLYDRIDSGTKDNIGFIAQELETTVPELVVTGKDSLKSVKYQNMTALLVEAIKEQQKQIEDLKGQLNGITK